jgi:uncharacterized protein YdhG (YjbR/CyaY superfamily)
MSVNKPKDIDEYISGFPVEIQKVLEQIRATVRKSVPEAEEVVSYDMPTFRVKNGYLVHFAAFKKHIGLYPAPTGNEAFEKEFAGYKTGKGSIQFPLDKPMPIELIAKILHYNLEKNRSKALNK